MRFLMVSCSEAMGASLMREHAERKWDDEIKDRGKQWKAEQERCLRLSNAGK